MKHPAWCLIDTNKQRFRCVRCGNTMPLPLPMPVDAACKLAEAFSLMHRDCKDPTQTSTGGDDVTDIDEAFLAERERIRAADANANAIVDAVNHQPALIDEIRRLRDLLTRCAKELPVNQDPTTFDLLREFEA